MKKVILIPPWFSYGDCFSIIGMIYFLLEYYDHVYFCVDFSGGNEHLLKYFQSYFSNDKLFNKKIYLTNNPEFLINEGNYDEYHIINTNTGSWNGPSFNFYYSDKINKNHYFNDLNPIYNFLNIKYDLLEIPNKHLPNKNIEINHIIYYKLIGLNNNVRMDYFNYSRNIDKEIEIKNNILRKNNLDINSKYNVVNDINNSLSKIKKYIKNNYPIINIHYLADSPGDLLKLLEDSEEIHFIESINANFFYHCQYKNIFRYNKQIYLHEWLRHRNWPEYNLDYSWKMYINPKFNNWKFIFQDNVE